VREAIRRLEAEGLVIYRPNAGAQVAPADPGLFDEEMTVLAVLEGYGTALAAPWARPRSLASRRSTTRWRWR
jgi:DNA-binding GntR family transcriptional regulator